MRHKVDGYRLNRSGGHRTAMKRTMMKQLFEHERIKPHCQSKVYSGRC